LYDEGSEECTKRCSELLSLVIETSKKIESKTESIISPIESFLALGKGSDESHLVKEKIGERQKIIKDLYIKAGLIIKDDKDKKFIITKDFKNEILELSLFLNEEECIKRASQMICRKLSEHDLEKIITTEHLESALLEQIRKQSQNKVVDGNKKQHSQDHETIKLFFGKISGSCQYPISFLEAPGHDEIEQAFTTIEDEEDLKQKDQLIFNRAMILGRIYEVDDICLPEDLIKSFDELDNKIRSQVRAVIKPKSSVSDAQATTADVTLAVGK
jgi:hypothetical protein